MESKIIQTAKIKQCFTYFRAKRDGIEANVKQEEANIVNLTRELSQAKVQRKMQRALHLEAIKSAQDFSVNQYFVHQIQQPILKLRNLILLSRK